MEIIFDSGRRTHSVTKTVRIFSNDSTDSITQVRIAADVMPKPDSNFIVQVSQNILDFSTVDSDENEELEVTIRNITTIDLGIKIVDIPYEFVEVELSSRVVRPSEEVKLKVGLKREAENASLTKSITLELDDENKSRFTIPIRK